MSDNSVDIHSKRSSAERGTRRCRPYGLGRARGELRLGRMKPTGEYPASQLVINVTAGPLAPVATSLRAASSELADVSALYPRPRSMKSPPRPAAISASGIAYVAIRSREGPASGSREARSVPAAMSMTRRGVSSRSRASIVAFSRTRVRAMSSSISCRGLFPSYEARSSSGTGAAELGRVAIAS
jgi:hypothetical protein